MSWETVNPNEIDLDAAPTPAPAGTYTLQLAGAAMDKYRVKQTNVRFTITDEGEQRGKSLFLELPDPDDQAWAKLVYARLIQSLGATVPAGQHPVEALNAIAINGHSRVLADVFVETFNRKDGSPGSKNKISSRSIRPAA